MVKVMEKDERYVKMLDWTVGWGSNKVVIERDAIPNGGHRGCPGGGIELKQGSPSSAGRPNVEWPVSTATVAPSLQFLFPPKRSQRSAIITTSNIDKPSATYTIDPATLPF